MGVFDRLRGMFSRAGQPQPSSPPPETGGSVLPDQSLWQQFQRIGGSLKPSDVSTIIRAADTGDMTRLVDLANEMRQKDGHLQCVLQSREVAVSGLDWELVYPGETRKRKSRRGGPQKRFVEGVLKDNLGFRRLIAHLIGSVYYGYAVAEILWSVDGTKLVPRDFVYHSGRRFGFRQDDGKFVFRNDLGGSTIDGVDFQAEWPDKFIVAQPRVNGDVPCREGLVRVLMWLALFRNWSLSDWLKLAEMAWKPWRRGVYKKGASASDKQGLLDVLAGMTGSGVAIHPETVEVHLEWAGSGGKSSGSGQGGSHRELFEVAGREMSKAVLGQTLTTEQGDVGSRALGSVHNDVRRDVLRADAAYLSEVITKFLIEPMVRLNFGPNAPVPRLLFITEDIADMTTFATAVEKLAGQNVKLRIPAEWVRDELGIPHPEDDDELLGVYVDTSAFDAQPSNDPNATDPNAGAAQDPKAA